MSVRFWAAVVAALALVGAVPAAASEDPTHNDELSAQPGHPAAALAGLDPEASFPEMARAAAAAAGQDPVVQAEVDRSGIVRTGLPSGDMDGDGSADAVVLEVSYADVLQPVYDYDLVGLRGTDGRELWSASLGARVDALPLTVPDLTGDGLADVVVTTISVAGGTYGSCGSTACAQVSQDTHQWQLSVISGADGSVAWAASFDGYKGRAGASAALFPPGIIESKSASLTTAAAILPTLAGDHDGDGSPDLIVQVFDVLSGVDYRFTQQGGVKTSTGAYPSLVATSAAVVSGASGSEIAAFSAPFTPGGADLSNAGDLNGDGNDDLLWQTETDLRTTNSCHEAPVSYGCAGYETNRLAVEAIDGVTLGSLWTREIASSGQVGSFMRAIGASLDAGATSDLLLYDQVDVGGGDRRWWVSGYSGEGGTRLWRRETQSYPDSFDGTVLGSPDGQGADLFFVELHVRPHGEGFEVLLQRTDGATGRDVLETRWSFDRFEFFSLAVLGDGDGDEVADIGITSFSWMGPATATSRIESGASGQVFAERSIERRAILVDAGDLDADGSADALESDVAVAPDVTESVTAVEASGASTLWNHQEPHAPTFETRLGDLTGDGGDDVLVSRVDVGGSDSSVALLDGRTGRELWRRGGADVPVAVPTQLSFTDASASSVQHSDEVHLEAVLVDESGSPVEGAVVSFTWGGRTVDVVTDGQGSASAGIATSHPAGTYEASVSFAGDDALGSSEAVRPVEVLHEDSVMSLTVEGNGAKRVLRAVLSDADSGGGFGGREVAFYGDGVMLGTAVTDDSGAATFEPSPKDAAARMFEARFAGDDYLLASSATSAEPPRGPQRWLGP